MIGEFKSVWSELWAEVWRVLLERDDAPEDMFCELYREVISVHRQRPSNDQIAEIVNDPEKSYEAFNRIKDSEFDGERNIVTFLENAYLILQDCGTDELAEAYYDLVSSFVSKYSLRYIVSPPCKITPSLQGIFATLIREVKMEAAKDPHLLELVNDYEAAIRDLRLDFADSRIRTCIVRQINLLEGFARLHPNTSKRTIRAICKDITTWPHQGVHDALEKLYWFACDYPGIRHSGTPENALRQINPTDLLAISISLMGFILYLTDRIDPDVVYYA